MVKSVEVVGIGHGLMDLEYVIDDANTLSELGLVSEDTVLATETVQRARLEKLHALYGPPKNIACGGSVANAIVTASILGTQAYLNCKVAPDEYGNAYLSGLKEYRVRNDSAGARRPQDNDLTGNVIVLLTGDGKRSMSTYLGVSATFSEADLHLQPIKECQTLLIEGYFASESNTVSAAIKARKAAKDSVLLLSAVGIVEHFRGNMEEIIGDGVGTIIGNASEVSAFTGETDAFRACKKLTKHCKTAITTRGEHGALLCQGGEIIECQSPTVTVKDPLGSGDAFTGAFLAARSRGVPPADALQFACQTGSVSVTQMGPRLNHKAVTDLKNELDSISNA